MHDCPSSPVVTNAVIAERGYAFRDVRRWNPCAAAGLSPSRSQAESGEQAPECVMVAATRRTRASLASNLQTSWRAKKWWVLVRIMRVDTSGR